jgi:hypothetical protein
VSVTLFRPVGLKELELILASAGTAFPPRLPEQPIFYPVLNYQYAAEIARDWNAPGPSQAGFVTRFEVDGGYLARFDERSVGARRHRELWVPAEQLDEFNRHLAGVILIVAGFFGAAFRGSIPAEGPLAGRDARTQFATLAGADDAALREALRVNAIAVQANVLYWRGLASAAPELSAGLGRIAARWRSQHPRLPLPGEEVAAG